MIPRERIERVQRELGCGAMQAVNHIRQRDELVRRGRRFIMERDK